MTWRQKKRIPHDDIESMMGKMCYKEYIKCVLDDDFRKKRRLL
jgi:hypothetical protein